MVRIPCSYADDIVARVNDRVYSVEEFLEFLAVARHPGYRPATQTEAVRLLRAFLGERLLDQEAARRGLPENESGRETVLSGMVKSADTVGDVTDDDVRSYFEAHRALFEASGVSSPSEVMEELRARLRGRRRHLQRRAFVDLYLDRARVEVLTRRLGDLVGGEPSEMISSPPLRPPGLMGAVGPRP